MTLNTNQKSWSRMSCRIMFFMMLSFASGCTQLIPASNRFGDVKGVDATRSLNGTGIFQKLWQAEGVKCLYPQKLSPRLDTMDAIVLVGNTFDPPGKEARDWLENWLAEDSGRTVIYFGRDFNAEIFYRRETLGRLSVPDQLLGRARLARSETVELNQRLSSFVESTFCRWFYLDVEGPHTDYVAFQGDWSGDLVPDSGTWPVKVTLRPPRQKFKSMKPSWLTGAPVTSLQTVPGFMPGNRTILYSRWWQQELDTDEKWAAEFEDLPDTKTLLSTDDGTPLVYRLTSEDFPDSQIIIVTNGAPFLNGSIVQQLHQRVARKVIEEAGPVKRVAMLQYDDSGITISVAPEKEPQGGLEFLMVWPISAVTMPAALLCILGCAALWPILGRPRKNLPRRVSDFGLHIEALGKILHDSRDLSYAKEVVSQYFQRVREETPPAWLETLGVSVEQPELQDQKARSAPVSGEAQNLSTKSVDELFEFNSQGDAAQTEGSEKQPAPQNPS